MNHPCPIPGCTEQVRMDYLMCWGHWRRVPLRLRSIIWDEVKSTDRTEYDKAVKQAIEIVTEKEK